jgi:hypothetical protein
MAIAGYIRIPVMGSVDAMPNGTAIGIRASAFVWASILAMLTDIALFFDDSQHVPRSVSDIGVGGFESPFFDIRFIPWLFADPILTHSGGLEINAECRVFLLVGIGDILSKTAGMLRSR